MSRTAHSRRRRFVTLALLLPALALRALVPTGFMPSGGGDDILALQMCSAGSAGGAELRRLERDAVLQAFDPAEQGPRGHEDRRAPCDFTLASLGAAPPPATVAVVVDVLGREARPRPLRHLAPVPRSLDHAQQPRAPPRFS
jgi:hypothetical protein